MTNTGRMDGWTDRRDGRNSYVDGNIFSLFSIEFVPEIPPVPEISKSKHKGGGVTVCAVGAAVEKFWASL